MSEGQPRDEGGRFGEKLTDQAVLKVFDAVDEPFLTTSEVHEKLDTDVSQKAVYHRLNRMHEEGLIGKKKTGARSVGWWAKVAPRLAAEAAERAEAADRDDAIALEELQAEFDAA